MPTGGLNAQTIEGTVKNIVDGDTFDFSGLRIRLCGIEAPEEGAHGSESAKEALTALVASKYVVCLPVGAGSVCDGRSKQFNRNRVVAQCFLDDSDIAALMVKNGHACDWPKFSGGAYRGGCAR
jgi:endonuclease YncB( thermonuclease family)